ncbi:hypothetical protein F2Q69_00013459 [Brassica cretica]|uniref:Uncharacterized protein n=1 Tax=Brassica cretica TaxID=69181 RepID=A0A8S9QX21_BRACR|nr:hypothetical protein F2Q69_00013459 [Brassica cretica]
MEGSLYRKFSISWRGARFQRPNSGFLLAGTWSVPLSGTRGSGSCLEAGGNDTGPPNFGEEDSKRIWEKTEDPAEKMGVDDLSEEEGLTGDEGGSGGSGGSGSGN